jgi:transketolase
MPFIYPHDETPFEIGVANLVRQGSDLTIIACGLMVGMALDAAAFLAEDGIQARVTDLHTLRPLDKTAIQAAARETGAIVCAEEHLLQGGMGSNVARLVAEHFPVPMRFIGLGDVYAESADPDDLLQKYHLTAKDIASAGREVYRAKQRRAR